MLAAGELFCRVSIDEDQTLCMVVSTSSVLTVTGLFLIACSAINSRVSVLSRSTFVRLMIYSRQSRTPVV